MKNEINRQAILLRKMAEKILDGRPNRLGFNLSPIETLKLIHELEVHQIELEMQNDELGLRNEMINKEKIVSQSATTKYSNLYDHAPTGYFVLTHEGEIIDLNLNAAKKLGIDQTQFQKKRFGLFVSEDTRPKFNDFIERIYENRSTESCQVVLTSKTNVTIHVHISGVLYEEKGLCFLSVIDITARIEQERHREITHKILQLLNEPGNMHETVHRVLCELKRFTGYDAIGLRLKDGDDFPYFDQIGFPTEFLITENTLLEYDRTGKLCRDNEGHPNLACTCGLVLSGKAEPLNPLMTEGGSWWVNDSTPLVDLPEHLDARFRPRNLCIYQGYSSIVLIPIRHNSTIIGLIQFNDLQKNRFTRTIVEHLEEIASHIGAAMLRKQAEDKLFKNEELLRTITENAPDRIIQLDRSGTIVYINRGMYGRQEQECIGKNFCDWTLPEYHSIMNESLNLVFEEATGQQYQSQETDQQGGTHWIQTSLSPIKIKDQVGNVILVSRDVTSTIKAEETIRENDRRHRAIVETAMDGFCVVDKEGRLTEVNESCARMSGYTMNELQGMQISDFEVTDKEINLAARVRDIIVTGESRFESQHLRRDGSLLHIEISVQYQGNHGGQFIAFLHDITARKQAEEKLRQSEERYKSLFQGNYSVMLLINPENGEIRDANPAACKFYGWSRSELCVKNISEINTLPPDEIGLNMHKSLAEKQNHYLFSHRLASGELRDVEVYSGPIGIHESTLLYTIIHDITEQKKAEEALLMSEQRLDAVFNGVTESIMMLDLEGNILMGNQTAADRWGLLLEELPGKNAFELSPPDIRNKRRGQIQDMISTGSFVRFEDKRMGAIYDLTFYPVQENSGEINQFVAFIRDVTEQKEAEEALRISEEKFRNLVWGMQAGILLFTPGFEVILSNPKAFELLGINESQLQKVPFFYQDMKVIHDDGSAFLQEDQPVAQVIATGKTVRDCIMGVVNSSTGVLNWLLVQAEPQLGKDGKLQQVICTFIDISELKKKDDELKKLNQTLAALSKSSQAMVHSMDETEYLGQVCNIVREDCGYSMVWIGFSEENEAKNIKPVANAGFEDGYLETIRLSWGDNEFGRGPTGQAIRTGQTSICTNMLTDPTFMPWREDALKRGYSSSISIPLLNSGIAFGAITIYSRKLDPFTEDEVKLLNELANDLAYGITAIRLRKAHQEAQKLLSTSYEKLEEVVKLRTRELEVKNEQLNAEIKIRIQQEQHLKSAEEKYRTVADFTYNMETWIDTHGKYIYVSPSSKIVTGYPAEEFMNDPELLVKIAHPDDATLVRHHFDEKNKGHVSNCSLDFRIITFDGEVRWVGHTCQKVFNVKGKWIGQRGSNRDITTQKNEKLILIESKKHLQALTHRMDVVAEEERIRISREIHDELGHLLTALKYDMEGLKNTSGLTIEMVKSELSALNSMVDSLIDSVRKIATELRPGILDHLGIFPAIEWKIKQFRMRNKISCEYQIEEMNLEFNKDETTIIYRILQEIFTNISRHSKAKNLWVSIYKSEGYFIMKVRDDGVGFVYNASLQTGSLGLLGMNERAMSIGGEIDIVSTPWLGTTVTFSLKK